MIEFFAIISLLVIGYAYMLFPIIVIVRGRMFARPWNPQPYTPTVDFVIICHNEAGHIEEKLSNIIALDYPQDKLRIIVASDGSDDGTDDIVRPLVGEKILLHSYPRRGKIPALNDAVLSARSELLVFSDANSQFDKQSLRKLTQHFADASIGCVAGNQVYSKSSNDKGAAAGERTYWNMDRQLKIAESQAGNTISATGAIYAIRRNLFQEVPPGVTDDFTISTRVILQGYRIVFEPAAIAREAVAGKSKAEFRRKVRVMTRGLRAVWTVRKLLNPFRYHFYALQLFSHKVVRRLMVFPLLLLLLMTPWLFLAGGWLRVLAVAQVAFYGLALVDLLLGDRKIGKSPLFKIPHYFCLVNAAAIVASFNFIRGRRIELWETHRAESNVAAAQPNMRI